jgi:hypothetical protein
VKKRLQIRPTILEIILFLFVVCISAHTNLCVAAEDYSNLKVTEISYHPLDVIDRTDTINGPDTTQGKDLEFIEFKNIGETSINLSGLILDSAVYYVFPNDVQLGAKHFWVVASKPSKFLAFYGMEPSGNFSGNLANSGDEIFLRDALNNEVIRFTYDDHAPWPEEPDGDGYTLVSNSFNPIGDPADYAYWRSSLKLYGSPFRDDDGQSDVEDNMMLTESKVTIYPNPANEYIAIYFADGQYSDYNIKIYSANGLLVYQSTFYNNEKVILNNLGFESGIYFISIETNNFIETKKVIFSR